MTELADLGVMGLAVMGANLARNAARKGFGVALYNRHGDKTDALVNEFGHEGRFSPTKDLASFVAALAKPRVIIIMVKAGKPVDDVIDELLPHAGGRRHRHRRRQFAVHRHQPPLRER